VKTLFYFTISLCLIFIGAANPYDEKKHTKVFYGTLGKVSRFIEKKYKLIPIGSGGKAFGGPITKFRLSFDIRAPLSREQLRKLLIDCSKDFLTIVNTDKEVQPYLSVKPFELENIEIIIFNSDKTGREVFDPLITVAKISGGILIFKTNDPNKKYTYKENYKETYEEALKLVQENEKAKS
jgi:hypothetical protein